MANRRPGRRSGAGESRTLADFSVRIAESVASIADHGHCIVLPSNCEDSRHARLAAKHSFRRSFHGPRVENGVGAAALPHRVDCSPLDRLRGIWRRLNTHSRAYSYANSSAHLVPHGQPVIYPHLSERFVLRHRDRNSHRHSGHSHDYSRRASCGLDDNLHVSHERPVRRGDDLLCYFQLNRSRKRHGFHLRHGRQRNGNT